MIEDTKLLADLVTALGGTVIPGPSFRFDLPLSQVRDVVPKISKASGLGVRKVDERQDDDPKRAFGVTSIATLELYRPHTEEYRLPEGF